MSSLSPLLRFTLIGFAGLALIAGGQLFIGATETEDWFSWTIQPPLTAAAMAGVYWGAFVLFVAGARAEDWPSVRPITYAALAIAVALLIVTLVHLERFDMDSLFGVFWLCAYIVAPPLLVWGIVMQRRTPAATAPGLTLPTAVRTVLLVEGAVMAAVSAVLLLAPETAADFWPWALTPLTSRALGALLLGIALVALLATREAEIRMPRAIPLAYVTVGFLELAAVALHSPDLGSDDVATGVFVAFAVAAVLTGLYALSIAVRASSGS